MKNANLFTLYRNITEIKDDEIVVVLIKKLFTELYAFDFVTFYKEYYKDNESKVIGNMTKGEDYIELLRVKAENVKIDQLF